MKAYVITILENERSVMVADRCIRSGKKFGLEINKWAAITPRDNPVPIAPSQIMINHGIYNYEGFLNSQYSREDRAMCAFLSHYSLWKEAVKIKEDILIFEHDAVVVAPIPNVNGYKGCISFGKPSYGNFNIPRFLGVQELQSKTYFPGAHAYLVSWQAAEVLIKKAKVAAAPTDVFLNKNTFPFLQEYYPWPVEVNESFSTIQKERGCLAKHQYMEGYQLI